MYRILDCIKPINQIPNQVRLHNGQMISRGIQCTTHEPHPWLSRTSALRLYLSCIAHIDFLPKSTGHTYQSSFAVFLKKPCSILRATRNMHKLCSGILSSMWVGRPLQVPISWEYVPLWRLMPIGQSSNWEIFLRIKFKFNHNKFKLSIQFASNNPPPLPT